MTTKQEAMKLKHICLKMFLKGISREKIIEETKISIQTYENWKKQGNWYDLRNENQTIIRQDLNIDIAKEKEKDLEIINTLQNVFKQEINKQIEQKDLAQLPKNTQLFNGLLKAKWEILMPKTISQYNFMKTETNNTLISNEEATRAMEALKEYERRIANKSN